MEKFSANYNHGPWEVKTVSVGTNGYHCHKIYANDGKLLIATVPARNPFLFVQDQGNVRLIRKAPEMFERLKECCAMLANANLCDVNAKSCEKCHLHILLKEVSGE